MRGPKHGPGLRLGSLYSCPLAMAPAGFLLARKASAFNVAGGPALVPLALWVGLGMAALLCLVARSAQRRRRSKRPA